MMIGSYLYSQVGYGSSNATSADTHCIDCFVVVSDVSITNSVARSITPGNVPWLPAL